MEAWPVSRSTANVVGRMPIRISIIKPIPFWPSLDPCPKLTPVHVRISRPRIHSGGGWSLSGASYKALFLINTFINKSNRPAQTNPTIGETSSEVPTSVALAQFTPSPNTWPGVSKEFASPTPIIDPISACELDAGSPKYQVPRFQMIAEVSSAKTIANPAPEPTFSTNSTGSSASTPNATPPVDCSTPIKFQQPDQTTATMGFSEWV